MAGVGEDWTVWLDEHGAALVLLARQCVASRADAEDVVQEKLLHEWNKVPLDATALKLIDSSRSSRMYLHRGARLQRCDWSLDYQDGIGLLLPHLAKARDLARLVALHARQEFAQGHWQAGVEDTTAILGLARHVGADPIMICLLVSYAIESIAIEATAPYLPELKALAPRLLADFEALPAAATFPQTVLNEKKHMAGWLIEKLKEEEQRNQAQIALFKAALAVVRGGPGKLKDLKDPFDDGPFEYRAVGNGFELKSKLIFKGEPVTLVVGQTKKK